VTVHEWHAVSCDYGRDCDCDCEFHVTVGVTVHEYDVVL
jgi:hypothetical protein